MATNIETMWVSDQAQLQATVQTLVSQGGILQSQTDTQAQVFLKKKMNVAVLVIGLILCLVPGLVYLIWYTTADQSQQISVQIGQPTQIRTEAAGQHTHWYDQPAVDGAAPGSVRPEPTTPPAGAEPQDAPAPPVAPAPPAAAPPAAAPPTVTPTPPAADPTYPPVSDPPPPTAPPAGP